MMWAGENEVMKGVPWLDVFVKKKRLNTSKGRGLLKLGGNKGKSNWG